MASKKRGPHVLTCACFDSKNGWVDAGCIYHGIKSGVGLWDFYDDMERFRRAIVPDIQMRLRGNAQWEEWG